MDASHRKQSEDSLQSQTCRWNLRLDFAQVCAIGFNLYFLLVVGETEEYVYITNL
jgi:hypothetical protein